MGRKNEKRKRWEIILAVVDDILFITAIIFVIWVWIMISQTV